MSIFKKRAVIRKKKSKKLPTKKVILNKYFSIVGSKKWKSNITDSEKLLVEFEKRFKRNAKLNSDITAFPLPNNISNIEINKSKSKEFSEVFTPLWLVDEMISQVKFNNSDVQTLDLCAGYGQFSIRLLRYMFIKFPGFNVRDYIINHHAFSELQLSSCYKLLNSFSMNINLFIGDSTNLNKLPRDAKGIWCYIEEYGYWACLTKTVKNILKASDKEEKFVKELGEVIFNLNKTYKEIKEMYNVTLQQMMDTEENRLLLISQINETMGNLNMSAQSVNTPQKIVDEMLTKVEDLEKKSILVLFNMEIIEGLIYKKKIDPKQITFAIEKSSDLKAQSIKKMYGVDMVLLGNDFKSVHKDFSGKKFDVALSNPPYNDGIDIEILISLINNNISNKYVIVHPSTWIIDRKNKVSKFVSLKNSINGKLKTVKFFNGNKVFGIKLFVPCMISDIDISYDGKIEVSFFNDKFNVDSINDITKFGKDWLTLVDAFYKQISKYDNIWSHRLKSDNVEQLICCQIARIRGNVSKDSNHLVTEDFYTMLMKDTKENEGIRKPIKERGGPAFGFSSKEERDNFLNYLKTDFARFCFALLKNKSDTDCGEMTTIPWLDFTQAWDDKKLFDHFDINKDTQDYIRKFLPDYYGIRK